MTETLILHIGLPKTGNTYLQRQLALHRDELLARGVYVPIDCVGPDIGNEGSLIINHNSLAWALQSPRAIPGFSPSLIENAWNLLRCEIQRTRLPKVFISAEAMSWELLERSQIENVRSLLPIKNIEVVVVERDPADLVESLYREAIARWEFSGGPFEFVHAYWPHLMLSRRLSLWSEVFGSNSIKRFQYEDLSRTNYFSKFTSTVLGLHDLVEAAVSDAERNLSIPEGFVDIFKTFNRHHLKDALAALRAEIPNIDAQPAKVFSIDEKALVREILKCTDETTLGECRVRVPPKKLSEITDE